MPTTPKIPAYRPELDQPMQSLIGRDFDGRYRVDAELGQGGSGVVYRAWNRRIDQPVALKLLRRDVVGPKQRRRFEREAKALEAVAHPNIVAVLDCGVSDEVPYIVMELLEGQSLAEALRQHGRFELARAEQVLRELLSALAFVHASGLVHRDLKPGNVFLQRLRDGREQVKLLDFGLAKFIEPSANGDTSTLTRSGEVFGTPAYMPLEQWSGQAVDARADVYAAGVVAFELFAGAKPFAGDGQEMLRRQLTEVPPPLHALCSERVARPELERLLQRAISRQARDRFKDASELAAAFGALPRPWLYEGREATAQRRKLAQDAYDSMQLGTAETVEQPAASAARSSSGVTSAAHGSWFARALASLAELVRRVVVASAWTLSVISVVAIAAAAAWIFLLRSPDHGGQRSAIEHALSPQLREAVARSAQQAESAVRNAVDDANQRMNQALPQPAAEPAAGASAPADQPERVPADQDQDEVEAARAALRPASKLPPARDPFRSGTPRALRALRSSVEADRHGSDRMLAEVRHYNREHPHDPRGHLLLARLFVNRNAWPDVVAQYQLAFSDDASSRGDPHMLRDLLRAVVHDGATERAIALIASAYGRDARAASERARVNARSGDERARLERLLRALSP
jgi:serine/threonine protein kinase